jgi:hypothetical protein
LVDNEIAHADRQLTHAEETLTAYRAPTLARQPSGPQHQAFWEGEVARLKHMLLELYQGSED